MSDSRTIPQQHKRALNHNYHGRGIYLVTCCTEGRLPLLGTLTGNSADTATIVPTKLGEAVEQCWQQIPTIQKRLAEQKSDATGTIVTRDISLLAFQLMPDHIHGILFVRQEMDIALGDVIRGFMVGCTQAYAALRGTATLPTPPIGGTPNNEAINAISAVNFADGVQSDSVRLDSVRSGVAPIGAARKQPLFEKGYHDRLLKHSGQLQQMIDYVHDNPRRLWLKRNNPNFFAVRQNICLQGRTVSMVGNHLLLEADNIVAVHVRSRFTDDEARQHMNDCILKARQGAVLVSPFISPKEQMVRAQAIIEELPLIQISAEKMHQFYKPSGDLITLCAQGKALIISIGTLDNQRRISRSECEQMNNIAETLTNK